MPYITASIIFQLLAPPSPPLKKIQEEGPTGQPEDHGVDPLRHRRALHRPGLGWLKFITRPGDLVYPSGDQPGLVGHGHLATLTAGTVFLMWLGEQIDKHGIGNGVSLIIMAGILTGMPNAIISVYKNFEPGDPAKMGWMGIMLLAAGFVIVIAGSVLITVAQRRIPVQQAKHTRGRRVFGGQRSYLPSASTTAA
jgi:preprotein translocase subunit SecY